MSFQNIIHITNIKKWKTMLHLILQNLTNLKKTVIFLNLFVKVRNFYYSKFIYKEIQF